LLEEDPEFKIFNLIGSGLQKHFGHVTIAHQDSSNTIPTELKKKIDDKIHAIVEDIDPNNQLFEIIVFTIFIFKLICIFRLMTET